MKCVKCGAKDAVSDFKDCDDCYEERKRRSVTAYYNRMTVKNKCVRCDVDKVGPYHWCFNCFSIWDKNGRSFPEDNIPTKCLIKDD
jgi:hypothetical protein